MLVLSRRSGEEIHLPELGIVISVQKVRGKSVTVGVHAPQQVRILRGELVFDPTHTYSSAPQQLNASA